MERCNNCINCLELNKHKRVMLHVAQPYKLVNGHLRIDTTPPVFDNEAWNRLLDELPCLARIPYIKVSQVKVGDVLKDTGHRREWGGSNKELTVMRKGGVTVLFYLQDGSGREYRANGKTLTAYSHTIVFRDGKCIGHFFCKYW